MARIKAATVEEYLADLPKERRSVLSKIRALIKRNLPKGYVESINWGAIVYEVPLKRFPNTYNGQPLCYAALAAQKNYFSIYLMSVYGCAKQLRFLREAFKKAGKRLDMGKSCVHFHELEDLPLDAIAKIISSTAVDAYIKIYEASRKK